MSACAMARGSVALSGRDPTAPRCRGVVAGLLMLAALLSPHVRAAEMLVQGEVVQVVPLSAAGSPLAPQGDCQPVKPAPGAGLIELLQWDLRTRCPAPARVTGYRVYYRWDDRTYSRVVSEPPGETVSLRVRLQ